jgi:hypothetical protein
MNNKPKIEELTKEIHMEEIIQETVYEPDEITSDELDDLLPQPAMNVAVPTLEKAPDASALISDDQYLGLLDEIINNIREDRKQVSEYIDNMADMVINDGDATTSTKEALVNLVKVKTDLQDKMLKLADLKTRLKLKNTYAYSGPHLNAMQQNNYNIGTDGTEFNRKELIRAINNAKKKKDNNG